MTLEDEERLTVEAVKLCPLCHKSTFKESGCNYMKCSESDPKSDCVMEWCWACVKPKYKPIAGQDDKGFCNDSSHNSH
jgi:hypothetical protein